jgi:hypothetical protein
VTSTGDVVAESNCGVLTKPSTEMECNTAPCDVCAGLTCFNGGTCNATAGVCTCTADFTGFDCYTPASCSGVLDKDNQCCEGVLVGDGSCCTGSVAADGTCCAGKVDACGVCGGTGTAVDVLGHCCNGAAAAIGEDGLCCASGVFDTCGVCDGDDSSCNIKIGMGLAEPEEAGGDLQAFVNDAAKKKKFVDAFVVQFALVLKCSPGSITVVLNIIFATAGRRLAAGDSLQADVTIDQKKNLAAASATSGLVSATEAQARLSEGRAELNITAVSEVKTAAVCGNGVCEAGEQQCKQDCPYTKKACPSPAFAAGECSDNGICIGRSGQCDCFTARGYVGAACDQCKAGYRRDAATQQCVYVIAAAARAPAPTTTPAAPAAGPVTHRVRFTAGLSGYTTQTFDAAAQGAYKSALAAHLALASDTTIALSGIVAGARRQRRLAGGSSVSFTVTVGATSVAQAAAMKGKLEAAEFPTAFKKDLEAAIAARGLTAPADLAVKSPTGVESIVVGGESSKDIDWIVSIVAFAVVSLVVVLVAKWRNRILGFCGVVAVPRIGYVKTAELTQV